MKAVIRFQWPRLLNQIEEKNILAHYIDEYVGFAFMPGT